MMAQVLPLLIYAKRYRNRITLVIKWDMVPRLLKPMVFSHPSGSMVSVQAPPSTAGPPSILQLQYSSTRMQSGCDSTLTDADAEVLLKRLRCRGQAKAPSEE